MSSTTPEKCGADIRMRLIMPDKTQIKGHKSSN